MKKTLLLIVITIFGVHGCIKSSFSENDFIEATTNGNSDIVLMERGKILLEYNPMTWQLCFNDTEKEFRVQDDNLEYYYAIKCNRMPVTEGETIEGKLRWTTYNDNVSRIMQFTVSKINEDGKIWLWNAKYQIGVVVVAVR